MNIEEYQESLLELADNNLPNPISAETKAAFRANPRHLFAKTYQKGDKTHEIDEQNLNEHLATIYRNEVIGLYKDESRGIYSTISQPTLVLQMLDLLKLKRGHRVFELGAGSGWNAAMMGSIVGNQGKVYSIEIIPEIAQRAKSTIRDLDISNVEIIEADAGHGFEKGAPYDRAVFTAGTYDLPMAFHEQVKEGGYLLVVIKVEGGGDQMFLLKKKKGYFESEFSMPCMFVPMTGVITNSASDPCLLESIPELAELQNNKIDERRFWWGGTERTGMWISIGIRSFLSISEPRFQIFTEDDQKKSNTQHWYFGLHDRDSGSLVIARKGHLYSYGNSCARELLMDILHHWLDLGMPSMASMDLKVFPIGAEVTSKSNQWLIKKNDSQFLWSLK